MAEKNLPILMVLQKKTDIMRNSGGGDTKFFGKVTPEMQNTIIEKFQSISEFYNEVFMENELIPAVGMLKVKTEAIAKSHKPNDLCRACPMIGSRDLDEIYIKVTKKTIEETVELIKHPPSKKFRANLTAISDIQPVTTEEKISKRLVRLSSLDDLTSIKEKVKVKIFDFDDPFDDEQIFDYVMHQLEKFNLAGTHEIITFDGKLKFLKVSVKSYTDIMNIASINGVKALDIIEEYSLPSNSSTTIDVETILNNSTKEADSLIGIIDGGISESNLFLQPFIESREEYIAAEYRNPNHATFIASTILFGNLLNDLDRNPQKGFKFVDVIAIPNSDAKYGLVDSIDEIELMEIIEEVVEKHCDRVKIWNLSLGIPDMVCDNSMSDLGIFLDEIQEKYAVQFFISSGNLSTAPLRVWPPQASMGERDRIISPADSVRALTVGSLALNENEHSIVKQNEPSPFSRRGPGANYTTKPEIVDFGGNLAYSSSHQLGLGVKGLDPEGNIVEGIGTSYANPRALQKYASVYDEMVDKDLLLTKAMIIHSSRMWSRDLLDKSPENIHYYGFGKPSLNPNEIMSCSEDEITLIFKQSVPQGSHLEMMDFPYPPSLIRDGKYFGEIGMTLVVNPILDDRFGGEYCRTNVEVSFGVYKYEEEGDSIKFKGHVPMEVTWNEKFESSRVENGFKWNPIKSYYRNIPKGIKCGDGWKIRIDMSPRNGLNVQPQEFVLIITIKDPQKNDIYSEVVNGLRTRGYVTNNIETRQTIRQRQ